MMDDVMTVGCVSFGAMTMSSRDLLAIINEARSEAGESAVRLNDFTNRVLDELDGEHYESFVVKNPNGTESLELALTQDQCVLVSMRESKLVRKQVLIKLKDKATRVALPDFNNPVAAARAWADAMEQKQALAERVALDAPAVEFAKKIASADKGVPISNFAKTVGLGPIKLFDLLRELRILMGGNGNRRNLPFQEYLDRGYFSVRESPYEANGETRLSFTPLITGKGQQWLTKKLIETGHLKGVAA